MAAKPVWHESGRGHYHQHQVTLGKRMLIVAEAPSLYGKWEVKERAGTEVTLFGQTVPAFKTLAYANDLREARQKAEAILRGEEVDRSPSHGRFAPMAHPQTVNDLFKRVRVKSSHGRY